MMPTHEAVTPDQIELPEQVVRALERRIAIGGGKLDYNSRAANIAREVLAALANDPMVPKEYSLANEAEGIAIAMFKELQRSAFLRKEEPLPEEVKALLVDLPANGHLDRQAAREHNEAVVSAYRLGLAKGKESK